MHWIQKHIMQQLSMGESRSYSELKPGNVDGNLFMYHMQQLKKAGYVSKDARRYTLSQKGKLFSSRMSLRQGVALMQPKVVVMLICQNTKGDYLLFRWDRQPYTGLVSFPFGKIHFGRTLVETLEETLFNKAHLTGDFAYVGDVYIKTLGDDIEVRDHTLAHIYRVTNASGELGGHDGLTGTPFWGQPQAISLDEIVPGFVEILDIIASGERGFVREVVVR